MCAFVALWTIQRSEVHSVLRKDLKQAPTKANDLDSSFHFFPLFSPLLSPSIYALSRSLSLYLYQSLSPSLVMLMIWCAGRGGTCARLTWDDTNRFITMGSPRDQKTHLKGVFQGINCLTWLTQVWETFRMAIKGLAEREKKNCAAVCQEDGWNISECVTSGEVFLTKSRVVSRQSYGDWVSHPSNPSLFHGASGSVREWE